MLGDWRRGYQDQSVTYHRTGKSIVDIKDNSSDWWQQLASNIYIARVTRFIDIAEAEQQCTDQNELSRHVCLETLRSHITCDLSDPVKNVYHSPKRLNTTIKVTIQLLFCHILNLPKHFSLVVVNVCYDKIKLGCLCGRWEFEYGLQHLHSQQKCQKRSITKDFIPQHKSLFRIVSIETWAETLNQIGLVLASWLMHVMTNWTVILMWVIMWLWIWLATFTFVTKVVKDQH